MRNDIRCTRERKRKDETRSLASSPVVPRARSRRTNDRGSISMRLDERLSHRAFKRRSSSARSISAIRWLTFGIVIVSRAYVYVYVCATGRSGPHDIAATTILTVLVAWASAGTWACTRRASCSLVLRRELAESDPGERNGWRWTFFRTYER